MKRDLGSGKLFRAAFLFAVFLMSASGQSLAGRAPIEKASRQWKIYIITHTHADIGYTDLIPEVERVWCQGIDQAISASEKGLKWTLEGSLLFDAYRRHRKPQKVERLVNLVREKKIEIASLYTNIEQEFAGPEELVRSTFYANDRLRREFDIESRTAILSDITGITWGLPRALSGAGTRYLLFSPGGYKELLSESKLPHLFYWGSPDGSKVLTLLRSGKYQGYWSASFFSRAGSVEEMGKDVADLVKYYESMGDRYPYDAIMLELAMDNVNPQVGLVDNIQAWNRKHQNPTVLMATPSEFFQYIEEKYREKIPEVSGDITSAWTDDPGIYAQASGLKRKAASGILTAEKFAVLAELVGSDRPFPQAEIEQVYKDLLIYTDHTYGMDNWWWEHEPLQQSRGFLHAPVFDYYKESWENKKEYAYSAARTSDKLLGDSLEALASQIPTDGRAVVVFNPLSWPRTDVVRILHRGLKVKKGNYYELIDAVTGEKVPYQALEGDRRYDVIAFIAKNVPALGYKTYRVVPVSEPPRFETPAVKVQGNVLENEFYRVEVDPVTGGVSSITDKELGKELVDSSREERVNQYVYYSLTGDHESLYNDHPGKSHFGRVPAREFKISVHSPLVAEVQPGHDGPVLKSLRSNIQMTNGPAPSQITQDVILYPGIKRIDFINRLHKKETLSKEEVYYAFPFDVKDFQMHCELPGAVFQPHKDQLSGSFTGFSGIQHWADVSNRDYGVAVATREVPAIEFGEIRTNDWSLEYNPTRSAFYFYVMNNKENTNGAFWQGSESWRLGFLELNFAITSHRGDWRQGKVTRFGWEHNTPLVARFVGTPQEGPLPATRSSFCQGLPDHVILQALKKAEDGNGYVARFYETEGKAGMVLWSGLPFEPRQAYLTTLVEKPIEQATLKGGQVTFSIAPYQMVTVRLVP